MVTRVRSPFASPFVKILLSVFWLVYAGMLVAIIVGRDPNLLVIVIAWTFILPWITWSFLSGVRLIPGRSVGGGPMYPRVSLEADEHVLFEAPALIGNFWGRRNGHVFLTDKNLITLPIRLYGKPRTTSLSEIDTVTAEAKGLGWPPPKERLTVLFPGGSVVLRPWISVGLPQSFNALMGTIDAKEFVDGLTHALSAAGVPVRLPSVERRGESWNF
jgi:hypothetical protein